MTRVLDASAVVAALVDGGPEGGWAQEQLAEGPLAAPHLMPAEVTNILRRAALAGDISAEVASLVHHDLLALRVELFPFDAVGGRVWELRGMVTAYDAWYVALAEELACPLVTLDRRLARAAGATCAFETP